MIAGVDARLSGDRAELADAAVDDGAIIYNIRVVAKFALDHRCARPHLGVATEPAFADRSGGMNERIEAQRQHAYFSKSSIPPHAPPLLLLCRYDRRVTARCRTRVMEALHKAGI